MNFEDKITDVFDFNLKEEVDNYKDTINEGMIDKIKDVVKGVMKQGWKLLPGKWQETGKGLLASAKKGTESAVEFILSLDDETIDAFIKGLKTYIDNKELATQMEEIKKENDETIKEGSLESVQAAHDATQQAIGNIGDVGGDVAYWALVVIGIIAAAFGTKFIQIVYKTIVQTRKAAKKGTFNRSRNHPRR